MTIPAAAEPKDLRPLDPTDLALVRLLAEDGRMTNQALADAVGIAPSTCLGRVRSLVDRGVIRGFHADVAPEALGHTLQAVIAVRLQPHARASIPAFSARMATIPGVLNVFFLAGADDFLLHVVAGGTQELRDFVVVHLNQSPDVAATETSLVFEHLRGSTV